METVKQPSARPTNKLMVSAVLGPQAVLLVDPAVQELWLALLGEKAPAFTGGAVTGLIGSLVAGFVGYYAVKDRPNVVTPAQ